MPFRDSGAEGGVATAPARPIQLNALVEQWDDVVERVRAANRLVLASALEHAMPVAVSVTGTVTLEVEDPAAGPMLESGGSEIVAALRAMFAGVERIVLTGSEQSAGPPRRLTHETVRDEQVASMRKRDPVLGAAIDALDLELLD
jgi:hypothetical protein